MCQQYHFMVFIAGSIDHFLSPRQSLITWSKFQRNNQNFAPGIGYKFIGSIFQCRYTLIIVAYGNQTLAPTGVSLRRKVIREMTQTIFRFLISIIMITGTNHIRQFSIQSLKRTRSSTPLLLTCLVAVHPIRNANFILLHQITGTKHTFYIQRFNAIGYPCCL